MAEFRINMIGRMTVWTSFVVWIMWVTVWLVRAHMLMCFVMAPTVILMARRVPMIVLYFVLWRRFYEFFLFLFLAQPFNNFFTKSVHDEYDAKPKKKSVGRSC